MEEIVEGRKRSSSSTESNVGKRSREGSITSVSSVTYDEKAPVSLRSKASTYKPTQKVTETPKHERLWPEKAIYHFVRLLTGCYIDFEGNVGDILSTTNFNLYAWWNNNELPRIESSYEKVEKYLDTMIRLCVEECRASVCTFNDSKRDINPWLMNLKLTGTKTVEDKDQLPKLTGTKTVEDKVKDQLPKVWLMQLTIDSTNDSNIDFMNGDLLLIHPEEESTKKYILGVVVPYMQLNHERTLNYYETGQEARETVTIMITVSENNLDDVTSGYCIPGIIIKDKLFSITAIGNVLTSIREAQGLRSLALLDESLIKLIISPPSSTSSTSSSSSSIEKLPRPPAVPEMLWDKLKTQYNASQLNAIAYICGKHNKLTLLQGPPGTGKTSTILGIMSVIYAGALNPSPINGKALIPLPGQKINVALKDVATTNLRNKESNEKDKTSLSEKKIKILLCANSNTAANELAYRVKTQGILTKQGEKWKNINIVRLGTPYTKHEEVQGVRGSPFKIKQKKLNESEYNKIINEMLLEELVKAKLEERSVTERSISDARKTIISNADVIISTLSGVGSQQLIDSIPSDMRATFKFDAIIIDEAAQAVESSSLIPFKFLTDAIIMIGDPCQLPATVFSAFAKRGNFDTSLFERLQKGNYHTLLLTTQYRMHPAIAEFSSINFYDSKLVTDSSIIINGNHNKVWHRDKKFGVVVFHDVKGEMFFDGNKSVINKNEADYIIDLLVDFNVKYRDNGMKIGIITPYNAQKQLIRNAVVREGLKGIEVSTIDGFQGREVDIVIFSCVRSSSYAAKNTSIGFLSEERRLNVAITRPKCGLWFIGDIQYFERCDSDIFKKLVRFMRKKRYVYPDYPEHNDNYRRGGSGGSYNYNNRDSRERDGYSRDNRDNRDNRDYYDNRDYHDRNRDSRDRDNRRDYDHRRNQYQESNRNNAQYNNGYTNRNNYEYNDRFRQHRR